MKFREVADSLLVVGCAAAAGARGVVARARRSAGSVTARVRRDGGSLTSFVSVLASLRRTTCSY